MKIGDKVTCIDPAYQGFLHNLESLTVTKIVPADSDEYLLIFEEAGDYLFPASSFEVIEEGPTLPEIVAVVTPAETPMEEVDRMLHEWRDKYIEADNNEDDRDKERCLKFIDFFLDKKL